MKQSECYRVCDLGQLYDNFHGECLTHDVTHEPWFMLMFLHKVTGVLARIYIQVYMLYAKYCCKVYVLVLKQCVVLMTENSRLLG